MLIFLETEFILSFYFNILYLAALIEFRDLCIV